MNREKEMKKNTVGVVIIAIFAFFLIINSVTPLMGEDISLMAFPKDYQLDGNIERFSLMFERIYEQMTNWNIRLGEQLSIVFGCFDKVVFNVSNSIMAIVYMWLIYQYAFKRKWRLDKRNSVYLISIFTLILILQPVIGEIFFWRTGSTNYLWAICFLLGFALPLRYYIGYRSVDIVGKSKWKILLLSIWGFLAGFTNENTIAVFILLYLGVILYDKKAKRVTPVWIYTSGATLLGGFICMYNAPSTANRIASYSKMYGIDEVTFQDYLDRAGEVIYRFFTDNCALVILTVVMILLYVGVVVCDKRIDKQQRVEILKINSENLELLLATAVSCGALIMSPYVETRSFLLSDFMMMACIIYYLDKLLDYLKKYEKAVACVMSIGMIAICIYEGSVIYKTYRDYYDYTTLRENAVALEDTDEAFFWGEYYEPAYSRILTTREDYLLSNEDDLSEYYGKEIKCWGNYVWNLESCHYKNADALGNIDALTYVEESDTIYIWGWGAFVEQNADESECYVYIDDGEEKHYFGTGKQERADVVQALYGEEIYLNSGFSIGIGFIHEWLGEDVEEVTIGFCVVNEENEIIAQIDEETFQLEQEDELNSR